jgi:hypothetical protein
MGMRIVSVCVFVGVWLVGRHAIDEHIDLGAGQPTALHFAPLKPRAYVERGHSLFEPLKGSARIDESTQQHIATDAGKTFQVSNPHRVVIVSRLKQNPSCCPHGQSL